LPGFVQRAISERELSGGLWTALRMPELQALRQRAVREFLEGCNRVVVPARWVADVLHVVGVPADRLAYCPQGVGAHANITCGRSGRESGPLRLAWLGRLDPTKGLHVLLKALSAIPDTALELDIYAIVGRDRSDAYATGIRKSALKDRRVRLLPALEHTGVVAALSGYDALAVPSQWLETGPLVVLEAFAAGIPVIGSDLGGIAELVEDGKNGVLVEASNHEAWSATLAGLAANRPAVTALAANVREPRTMNRVAVEMHEIYGELI
jgi:glycosyltransferase involved in cell wall biosynthesis